MRDWFNKKKGKDNTEETPLLGGGSTSRKSTRKVITIAVASVVALGVLGTAGYFIHNCHDGHKGRMLTYTLFFFFFKKKLLLIHFTFNFKKGYSPTYPPLTETEKLMLELPSNDNIRGYLKTYTSEAHLAGTESDKRQAEWTRNQFQSFGLNSTIETYWPMLNYPISHRFGIVTGPEDLRYEAKLTEDVVDEDETSKNPDNVPLFHGYSKNGTVTGRVVYANYGRVEDFQFLKDSGIELNGTIALVRYGGSFRGLKVRAAETFGCVGALIYSDPIDDGPLNKEGFPYTNPAKAYPEGPWRSKSSAQRGSVQYLSLLSGDPLTPGYAATEDAVRLDPEDSPGLTKIPSLPLSYEDALPILKATQGHGVRGDKDWSGGLEGVGYFSGPTEGEAILTNHIENKITPIWNVITRIEGTEESDKAIVLGNHRDAWVRRIIV
jgi:N-acetylated-alpha-linked acidic dipeptidase